MGKKKEKTIEIPSTDVLLTLPYQVPDGRNFVMGDHRATSIDSRNTAIGCIGDELVIGKIIFGVWPLETADRMTNPSRWKTWKAVK